PATRAGKRVTAIIRFEIAFHAPPPPEPAATPEATSSAPPLAPPPKPSRPAEVTDVRVRAAPAAPAMSTFTRAEIRQLPGAFGDPFRAIEAMPGVTPIVSGVPFFYVRGAPPGNVGYFFDGVRVPYLY